MKSLETKLWQQVNQAHILLIGYNEIGAQIAWQLATGLGIRQMTLIDPEICEQYQQVFPIDLNQNKSAMTRATLLAQQLVHFNPDLMIRCIQKPVTDELYRLKSRFDLIITSVENGTSEQSLAASWLSRELLIPHLNIIDSTPMRNQAAYHAQQLSLFIPFQGCVSCGSRQAGSHTMSIPSMTPTDSSDSHKSSHRIGSTVHLPTITASTALELWLSLLQERLGSFQQYLTWDHSNGLNATGATVEPKNTCNICLPNDTLPLEANDFSNFHEDL